MAFAQRAPIELVGRDAELAVLDDFFAPGATDRALCLAGKPGIGKTSLWEAGLEAARRQGARVLATRASEAEARLSFAALIDMLDEVDARELAGLPAPQRHALEVALLRAEPGDVPAEPRAIAVGLRNTLRSLADRGPVVIAIDDVQWLDGPSRDAIAFAARRLESEAVSFLLARRGSARTPLERALQSPRVRRLDIGPLSFGAIRRVLTDRLGISLPRHVLRRIVEVTEGNPLFALEVGRSLQEQGTWGAGTELPVPDAIEDLIGMRVARLPPAMRRLLLAVGLSGDLSMAELEALAGRADLDAALERRILVAHGERARAAHPLLAAAVRQRARARARRELHAQLAEVVAGDERRARHLALAAEGPDEGLAATLAEAAERVSARGARVEAAELAEHALRLTPATSDSRPERLLALALALVLAGEPARATNLLAPEIESLPPGSLRARAWILLGSGVVSSNADIERCFERALAESGADPELHAYVLASIADNQALIRVARIDDADRRAREALEAAEQLGGEATRMALTTLAATRSLRGLASVDLHKRFHDLSDAASPVSDYPERFAGQRLVWRGEVQEARELLTALLTTADGRSEPYSYALMRLHLCELELRIGAWDAAAQLLAEWEADQEVLVWPMYERCRALLAVGRGGVAEIEEWAARAIAAADRTGNRWDWLEALRARGTGALLAGDPRQAADSLQLVWKHTQRERVDEPGVFPVAPELVEALAALGELRQARAVVRRLSELAESLEHPWALVTAKRCEALVRLAGGRYDESAAADLAQAAAEYAGLGLSFDRGRALLLLGRAQRRHRRWAAARRSLGEAAAAFGEIGSPGWAAAADSELSRVGARRPTPQGALTPTEQRVVALAADGLSNKEIAAELFVTVHTVETHLSHAYDKLGVRSRGQLAARLRASA